MTKRWVKNSLYFLGGAAAAVAVCIGYKHFFGQEEKPQQPVNKTPVETYFVVPGAPLDAEQTGGVQNFWNFGGEINATQNNEYTMVQENTIIENECCDEVDTTTTTTVSTKTYAPRPKKDTGYQAPPTQNPDTVVVKDTVCEDRLEELTGRLELAVQENQSLVQEADSLEVIANLRKIGINKPFKQDYFTEKSEHTYDCKKKKRK